MSPAHTEKEHSNSVCASCSDLTRIDLKRKDLNSPWRK
jgi:hypothetical protein